MQNQNYLDELKEDFIDNSSNQIQNKRFKNS